MVNSFALNEYSLVGKLYAIRVGTGFCPPLRCWFARAVDLKYWHISIVKCLTGASIIALLFDIDWWIVSCNSSLARPAIAWRQNHLMSYAVLNSLCKLWQIKSHRCGPSSYYFNMTSFRQIAARRFDFGMRFKRTFFQSALGLRSFGAFQ